MSENRLWSIVLALALAVAAFDLGTRAQVGWAQAPSPASPSVPASLTGTAFNYQGQLKKDGVPLNGNCSVQFKLYADAGGTNLVTGPVDGNPNPVNVTNGLFSVQLDFGSAAFQGDARWLQTAVKCGSDSAFTPLSVQPLTPAPMALALPGLYTTQNMTSPNIIGGSSSNSVTSSVFGATIGGGGSISYTNRIFDHYGTIGGGRSNVAGDDNSFLGSASDATVGGGVHNIAGSIDSTVGGGALNTASGGWGPTVGGGIGNTASDSWATVPGGSGNTAAGMGSFAAGLGANALRDGTFVWGDASTFAPVTSTVPNQFVIRAASGVSLTLDAGYTRTVNVGERFRDNAIVAWAKIMSTGAIQSSGGNYAEFGVSSVVTATGIYTINLDATALGAAHLIPLAIAEVEAPPTSAAAARFVTINQVSARTFVVYVTDGNFALVKNDFVFIATAR